MYQLILLIHSTVNLVVFDEHWPDILEEVEKMPGLVEESVTRVDQVIHGPNAISRIYSFHFKDRESLEDSLLSESGEKAGKLLHDLTGGSVTILTGEYQADTLENIKDLLSDS
jgi:hypothetical protein